MSRPVRLVPFVPSDPSPLELRFSLASSGDGLTLRFRIAGEVERLRPPGLGSVPARAGDELWKRDCLEVFFFETGSSRYVELNWNLSGEFALLAFDDYRARSARSTGFEVRSIENAADGDGLIASLHLLPAAGRYLLSPTAVFYPQPAAPVYFALAHGGRPDFHRREVVEPVGLLVG